MGAAKDDRFEPGSIPATPYKPDADVYNREISFTIIWASGDYRIPLTVHQIFSHDSAWYVSHGHLKLITLYERLGNTIVYYEGVYDCDDIWAVVEAIEAHTGHKYDDVLFHPDEYPTKVAYRPPYFLPEYPTLESKLRYYRGEAKRLQQQVEAEKKSERNLRIDWRRGGL